MNTSASLTFSMVLTAAAILAPTAWAEVAWTDPVPVMNRAKIALTYRAAISGDQLIVEANHSKGWHTYAMDNTARARKASGSENPESEQPTRIAVSGGAKAAGPWRQTAPKDMSQPEIKWFTWGFEGIARFAVPIERIGDDDVVVTIEAQSCDPSSCTMVSDLKIVVPAGAGGPGESANSLKDLIPVEPESAVAASS